MRFIDALPLAARLALVAIALVTLVGCGADDAAERKDQTAAAGTAPTTTGTTTGAPVNDAPRQDAGNVVLEQPADAATIRENPFTVAGRARTFENHVEIVIRDAEGNEIETTHATARGEIGQFNPFEAEVLLTEWPGGRMTVEVIERSARDGSIRSLDRATVDVAIPQKEVKLYFPNSRYGTQECDSVFPVVRIVPNTPALARAATLALMEGPEPDEEKEGFSNPFPEGSGLRSIAIRNGTAVVDFNERLQNVGGSCRARAIEAAVTLTLRALPEVAQVEIRAGGSRELALQP